MQYIFGHLWLSRKNLGSQNKIKTLRDCLKSFSNEDYCLSLHSSATKPNTAGNRIKRTTSSVIEKSFLQDLHARNQMCQLPCQRQPLLVDKKKILAYLGFGHLVKQLNGFGLDLTVGLFLQILAFLL